jgi:hypothetical protein
VVTDNGLHLVKTQYNCSKWAGQLSRCSDRLRAGRSGDRIPVGARFSAPVQTGPGAHTAARTMDTKSFPGVKSGRGMTLTPHSLLVPWSRKCRATRKPLFPLWAVRPIQSLSACKRVHFIIAVRSPSVRLSLVVCIISFYVARQNDFRSFYSYLFRYIEIAFIDAKL